MLSRFLKNESGATAIEYGLIAALIAVVLVAALQAVGANSEDDQKEAPPAAAEPLK